MGEDHVKKGEGEFGSVFKPPAEKKGFAAFREFLYNSERGEFLGRTAGSWAKITIFYIIFYACLAAMWALFLVIFLQTLDATRPKWEGDNGLIGANPGLGFRPRPPDDYVDSTLIWFRSGSGVNDAEWKHWTDELTKVWDLYMTGDKNYGQYLKQCSFADPKTDQKDKFCFFDMKTINSPCIKESFFGYDKGTPCIYIKLNKIYGWEPEPYENVTELPAEMPDQLKETIKQNAADNGGTPQKMVWLSCEGENPADKENIGPIEYSPMQGFPYYYFPFMNTPGYMSPLVAIYLKHPEPSVIINIECKAWARNIRHNRMERVGTTHFELMKD